MLPDRFRSSSRVAGDAPQVASGVKAFAVAASLVASVIVMALALGSPEYSYLSWLTLLPLFFAIRLCSPLVGAGCGALWGFTLYLSAVAGLVPGMEPDLASAGLLTVIPGIYAFLGAGLTRWMGFSPFVLGVSWMGVELALEPLGLRNGLLATTQGGTTLMHWVGNALGYVLVAFVVAYVNAALLSALSGVRMAVPRPRPVAASGEHRKRLFPQTCCCFPVLAFRPAQPRAPPLGLS